MNRRIVLILLIAAALPLAAQDNQNMDRLWERASALYNEGNYQDALPYYLEILNIQARNTGKEHPDYTNALSWLGGLYQEMGDYGKAEPYFLESLAITEKTLGTEHSSYAIALNNLGFLYYNMGDYGKAESYFLESLAIREKALGTEHSSYAIALNNLGLLYQTIGDYEKAESYHLESLAIREKALGKEHPYYASSLNNLGSLYQEMGDYGKAEPYLLETLAITEKALGKEHPLHAIALDNLGGLYRRMGDYGKAEPYYLEALAIREKALGKEHPDYAGSLSNLGLLYHYMGDYEKAEPYYLEALAIREKALGTEHPDYGSSLNNLGGLYQEMGDYGKAEPYFLESLAITEKTLGTEHSSYGSSLSNLSYLYLSTGAYSQSETFRKENVALAVNLINRNFAFMPERQREAYWNTVKWDFDGSYSLGRLYSVPSVNALNYNNALFAKGLLLRTANAVRDAIYSSGDTALIARYEELAGLRGQISALRQKEDAGTDYIRSLEEQAEALDKALTQASREFRDLKADMETQWQDVAANLAGDEAAIEFVSFQCYDTTWTDTVYYAALVLRPGMAAPAWVPLCEEAALQDVLARGEGRSSAQAARIVYDVFGGQLYALVWQPLEEALAGAKTVYYAPAGLLHKVALNALPAPEGSAGERLVDVYDLNLVSSTREVVRRERSGTETALSSAVVYGGVNYDTPAETMRLAALGVTTEGGAALASAAAALPPELTRGGGGGAAWRYLESSAPEARAVEGYLRENHIPGVLYQGSDAAEESFKALDGTKTAVIHIATHGSFLPDIERRHDDREEPDGTGRTHKPQDNPLLRSMLMFSGANHAWLGEPVEGVEDGILTADEIARLNLLGTRLVILSACQTGLGDVKNGEGVFGLQRAFKLAGVETLIMSLWEVDDAATALLMDTFYRRWLASGASKQAAFKAAQAAVRAEYPAPFYWAAFVMMD